LAPGANNPHTHHLSRGFPIILVTGKAVSEINGLK
jgi:hypothetical protein